MNIFLKVRRLINLSLISSMAFLCAVSIGFFVYSQIVERRDKEAQARELLTLTLSSSLVRTYAEYRSFGLAREAGVFEGFIRDDLVAVERIYRMEGRDPPIAAFIDETNSRLVLATGIGALGKEMPNGERVLDGLSKLGNRDMSGPGPFSGAPYRFTVGFDTSGQRLRGYLEFSDPYRRTRIVFAVAALSVLLLLGGIFLLASHVARGAIKRVTDPIEHLTEVSLDIMRGKLGVRAVRESDDEIGILADAFNRMLDQLTEYLAERSRSIIALESSLAEKQILLKEVHHRVKNNMQVISSMIYLQRSSIDSPDLEAALETAENRIRSMALVHESLYRSGDFTSIELRAFFAELLGSIPDHASSPWEVSGDEVVLGLDKAVPCALAVNELAMNAIRHAQNGITRPSSSGDFALRLLCEGGILRIFVEDRGPGIDSLSATPAEDRKGIGLTLVGTLAQQLHGSLEWENRPGGGARFIFSFPTGGSKILDRLV